MQRTTTALLMLSTLTTVSNEKPKLASQVTINDPLLRNSFKVTEPIHSHSQIALHEAARERTFQHKQHKNYSKRSVDMQLPLLPLAGALTFSAAAVLSCQAKRDNANLFSKQSSNKLIRKAQDKRGYQRSYR